MHLTTNHTVACGETQGKITITTNKASVLNASQVNTKFRSIERNYINKGSALVLEGWFRTYVLFQASGMSALAFGKACTKDSSWTADTIRNRMGTIGWAMENIQTEGKKAVMWIDGADKFHSVVDSMEQIVVTRFPKQSQSEKKKAKEVPFDYKKTAVQFTVKQLEQMLAYRKGMVADKFAK